MATTEDGIPIVPSKSYQTSSIPNNPVQQLANSSPPAGNHDIGFSVEENVFQKQRLDQSLEEHNRNRRSR